MLKIHSINLNVIIIVHFLQGTWCCVHGCLHWYATATSMTNNDQFDIDFNELLLHRMLSSV